MRRHLMVTLACAMFAAAAIAACGSDDSGTGTNPGGKGGTAGSAGTGGTAGTAGGSGTAGQAGTAGSSGTGGAGGEAGAAGSAGAAGEAGAAGSAGGGAGAAGAPDDAGSGACTNSADLAIIQGSSFQSTVGTCATNNLGADPATKNCIVQQTGLSDACATCFGTMIKCSAQHCMTQCLADQNSQACKDCRSQNCDPAFVQCSGLPAN